MRAFLHTLALASTLTSLAMSRVTAAQTVPTLMVDAAADRHTINPNIYGIISYGLDAGFAKEIKLPNTRWGGDGTSRYNWLVDSSNSGYDWFFMGGSNSTDAPVPSGSVDTMIRTYKAAGATSLITIPILPYVNKSATLNCSFPVELYGPQQWTNPYDHPGGQTCGNSVTAAGDQLADSDIYRNHIDNSPTLQMGWVQHLAGTFGSASQGGVGFYQLDNEPGGWSNTHRDVYPKQAVYSDVVALGQKYAAAIKAVDPTAQVLGPSDYTLGGWIGKTEQQNGLFAGQYYLQQMAAADALSHSRKLDYFDEHYYFQFSNPTEQIASTRTLWDSTYNGGTWVEQWSFQAPMQLVPRFKSWIAQYYPGTKLSFSEYSIDSGNKLITDAVAQADVLGIFGREGVDFANMWKTPAPTDPIAYAFRLYRNFDGAGSQFGENGVQATSSDQTQLAVYAAERSADGVLTMVVLNKTAAPIETSLTVNNYLGATSAKAYQYSGADLTHIVVLPDVALQEHRLAATYPAYSATVYTINGMVQQTPVPVRTCLRPHRTMQGCKTTRVKYAEALRATK